MTWTDCKQEMPPIDPEILATQSWWQESIMVLAWGDITSFGDDIMIAYYDYSTNRWFGQHDAPIEIQGITHWAPLLSPPEGTAYNLYPSQVAAKSKASPVEAEAQK